MFPDLLPLEITLLILSFTDTKTITTLREVSEQLYFIVNGIRGKCIKCGKNTEKSEKWTENAPNYILTVCSSECATQMSYPDVSKRFLIDTLDRYDRFSTNLPRGMCSTRIPYNCPGWHYDVVQDLIFGQADIDPRVRRLVAVSGSTYYKRERPRISKTQCLENSYTLVRFYDLTRIDDYKFVTIVRVSWSAILTRFIVYSDSPIQHVTLAAHGNYLMDAIHIDPIGRNYYIVTMSYPLIELVIPEENMQYFELHVIIYRDRNTDQQPYLYVPIRPIPVVTIPEGGIHYEFGSKYTVDIKYIDGMIAAVILRMYFTQDKLRERISVVRRERHVHIENRKRVFREIADKI